MEILKELAGDRYSTSSADKRIFVNLLSLYCNIVGRNLISKNPRVMLSTYERKNVSVVSAMQRWVNEELVHMQFANTMQRIVLDGFISFGVSKVALATPEDAANYAWNLKAGRPYVARVSPDDFVMDMRAKCPEEARYFGNRYRVPKILAEENKDFNAKLRKNLAVSRNWRYNADGDERPNQITSGENRYSDEEVEDMVDLWDIYYPSHRCVYTFSEDQITGPNASELNGEAVPLGEKDWIGPDLGPYRMYALNVIPDQPIPKGPLQDVFNLHEAANNVYRKLVRQAKDCKDLFLYMNAASDDAARIKKEVDGGMVPVQDPKNFAQMTFGGVNNGLFLFVRELIDRFSWMAGNLVTMGGLAPQAGTLGQEELLSQQSNGQVAGYQEVTADFVRSNAEALNWYWWNDPVSDYETKYEVPGYEEVWRKQTIAPWNSTKPQALKRDGPMPKVKIDPHSMRAVTPSQRAQDLIQVVTAIYMPLAQMAQQQGISLDFNEFLRIIGDLKDIPDLTRVLTVTEPPQEQPGGAGSAAPGKPAETTRNYNRRSLGNGSAQAQDAGLDATLMKNSSSMNGKMSPSSM